MKEENKIILKRVLIWGSALTLIALSVWGLFWLASLPSEPTLGGVSETNVLEIPVTDNDWIRGNKEASVSLVEYVDFQCPSCGKYYSVLKQLENDFGGKVKFVYRYFPIPQIHKNALASAYAAEAAGRQGKFWEMHDLIFESQLTWSASDRASEIFNGFAGKLGLDLVRFQRDMSSEVVKSKVQSQSLSGERSGVDSTPSFFINGKRIKNPSSYEEFKKVLESAIQKNS